MTKRSSVERLPVEIRERLEGWLREFTAGRLTLDEVMTRLDGQFADQAGVELPSRSAVHRHASKFAAIAERIQRSKDIADQLVEQIGPQVADGKGLQVLAQGFQSLAFDMLANMDAEATMDPENLAFFARSIKDIASALKTDADRAMAVKRETAKAAAAAVKDAAGEKGLSAETADFIMKRVLGVAG